jgi:hypothetical protein
MKMLRVRQNSLYIPFVPKLFISAQHNESLQSRQIHEFAMISDVIISVRLLYTSKCPLSVPIGESLSRPYFSRTLFNSSPKYSAVKQKILVTKSSFSPGFLPLNLRFRQVQVLLHGARNKSIVIIQSALTCLGAPSTGELVYSKTYQTLFSAQLYRYCDYTTNRHSM